MSGRGGKRLRLLSYNIHGCVGRYGREDPDGIIEVIRDADADLVALQEVQEKDAADRSFLSSLKDLPFASAVHGRTMRKAMGEYGNILLSKQPLSRVEHLDLSVLAREPRGAIRAYFDFQGRSIFVTVTHLGLRRGERRFQIERLMDTRLPEGGQADLEILMGDMNEWDPRSRNMRLLFSHYPHRSTMRTFPARFPLFPLDRILIAGRLQSVRFERLDSPLALMVSDHRPLLAEIDLAP